MERFAGKVAMVTEAGRAEGRRHAVRLAEEGADIIAVDTTSRPDELTATAHLVEMAGGRVVAISGGLQSTSALTTAIGEAVEQLDQLDIVVAAVQNACAVAARERTKETLQQMDDANLARVCNLIKVAIPHVVRGGRGGAVVITSALTATPANENSPTQTELIFLTKRLANELDPFGIRVNSVHHTTVTSDTILDRATCRLFDTGPAIQRGYGAPSACTLTRMPVAAFDPNDVTNAALYLASDDGCYVTGTMHVVDARGTGATPGLHRAE